MPFPAAENASHRRHHAVEKAAGPRLVLPPEGCLVVVDKEDLEVRGEAQLSPAKLAQGEKRVGGKRVGNMPRTPGPRLLDGEGQDAGENDLGDIGQLDGELLRASAQTENRPQVGAEDLTIPEPPDGQGTALRGLRRGQGPLQLGGELLPARKANPLGRIADHRQDVLGLSVQVIFPEEMALAEDPDQGIEHLGLLESLEFLGPVGTRPWSRWQTG